jgi:kinesin family protein 11
VNLQGLSTELRQGLRQLDTVQGDFGREMRTELESYATKRQGVSYIRLLTRFKADIYEQALQADMAILDASFSAITDLASQLSKQHKKGQHEAAETSAALLKVKEEVQTSVRTWAAGVSEKSTKMVSELLQSQQKQLSVVREVVLRKRTMY